MSNTGVEKLNVQFGSSARGHIKPLKIVRFIGRANVVLSKRKRIRSANFQLNKQNNENVTVSSKYYREHHRACACNILIMCTYLMLLIICLHWIWSEAYSGPFEPFQSNFMQK